MKLSKQNTHKFFLSPWVSGLNVKRVLALPTILFCGVNFCPHKNWFWPKVNLKKFSHTRDCENSCYLQIRCSFCLLIAMLLLFFDEAFLNRFKFIYFSWIIIYFITHYLLLISTKCQRACFESCTDAIKSYLSSFTTWLQICFRIFANVSGSGVRIIYFQAGRLGSFTIGADRRLWQHIAFLYRRRILCNLHITVDF